MHRDGCGAAPPQGDGNLEPGGLHFPREWTWESNGQPERSLSINEIQFNPAEMFPDVESLRDAARKRLITPEDYAFGKARISR
jgi:hypothetical protein